MASASTSSSPKGKKKKPKSVGSVFKKLFRRKNIANKSYNTDEKFVFRKIAKDAASRTAINSALDDHFLFAEMAADTKTKLVNALTKVKMNKKQKIIKQGHKGNEFFVLTSGTADVHVDGVKVKSLEAPAAFGELALMYSVPRAATILATSTCVLWKVDRRTFQMTLAHTSVAGITVKCEFLRKVPLLKKLSNHQITTIAGAMQEEHFSTGKVIITDGDVGDKFYVIAKGAVEVRKDGTPIRQLKMGNFFGEQALMTTDPRNATCVSVGDVSCFTLSKDDFDRLLGPLHQLIAKVGLRRKSELEKQMLKSVPKEPSSPKAASSLPSLIASSLESEIKIIRTIGTGTFGRVKLVQHKASGKVMALKCLRKTQIVECHQEGNIMYEKNSMSEMDHPFILSLEGTYQDKDRLYMFLEIVQGGELWSLLYQKNVLRRTKLLGIEQNNARMYAACVASAFKHIHETGYAYRDLKPENLLVDAFGYIKIADFGFAKKIQSGTQTNTLCGTPEYLAPELVLSRGHNRAVDYWAFGVLVYELLVGMTPFFDKDQSRIFVRIAHSNKTLKFPTGFPSAAKDFVTQLLAATPNLRLGMFVGGADDILKHKWFTGINWDKLCARKYGAPWKPKVKHPLDDDNFDTYEEDDDVPAFDGDQAVFADF